MRLALAKAASTSSASLSAVTLSFRLTSTKGSTAMPEGITFANTTTLNDLTAATEARRRSVQRASDAQRKVEDFNDQHASKLSEEEKWWPEMDDMPNSQMQNASILDRKKRRKDGLFVPAMKEMPSQDGEKLVAFETENFFSEGYNKLSVGDKIFHQESRLIPPTSFDPVVDEIDDGDFNDSSVMLDVLKAAEEDRKRLEAFGNPVAVEDQIDYLLQPNREGQHNVAQRQEFNGFVHWGLLHAAHMLIDENQDTKKAHELVNRYMRDIDLFTAWLKHPKVVKHLEKKFGIDVSAKYDKLMGLTMCMYTRSKIQVYEDDAGGALKSLTAAMSFITEGKADLKLDRHRKAVGAILAARGMVYCKLKSFDRAEDDLTRALSFVNQNRSATLYQLRAEAKEALGKIDEARMDEEKAAEIWENADVVRAGLEGQPRKFVI